MMERWGLGLAMHRWLSAGIYGLSGLIGAAAFIYPFILRGRGETLNSSITLLLTTGLLMLCLLVLLLELQGQLISAKLMAALGLLIAVIAILRFVDNALPIPGGFSPIFAPIIIAGYVFGARFGFLLGVLTLLVSAFITGGIGPWLPYQMFTTGWVGMTAGWLPHVTRPRTAILMLASFGLLWGFLFGAIMNLYFWPFWVGETSQSWLPGAGLAAAVRHYATFYFVTSFWWDVIGATGNVLLIFVLGPATLRTLERFRQRFQFQPYLPQSPATEPNP